jgi:2,4-dichlorophenol 6-monooxygenase
VTPLPERTQVLIVGAGAAGLSASLMLGALGVDTLLVERRGSTSAVPKAHILHCRTMEIFAQFGLVDEVREHATPPQNFVNTSWYTSLGGDAPWDRKLLKQIPSWSAGALAEGYAAFTAEPMANLPQHLLEPILRRRAEQANGSERVRFGVELIGLEQDAEGVTAKLRERDSGGETTVRADYVIGADGGRTVGELVGIGMIGPEPFVDIVSIVFSADLSEYLQDDDSVIRLFLQPAPDGTVRRFSVVASGPERWDRFCTGWRSGTILPAGVGAAPAVYTEEQAVDDLRRQMKLPDLEITDVTLAHWLIESVYAERFTAGRVFLAGDAAHRHSPMGGLGLNTAVQDAHNLAWKLAAVLRGGADAALLESYEEERLPVARRRVEFSTFSFFNHLSVSGGFGMLPGATEEHNCGVLEALFADSPDGATRRAQLDEMLNTLRREFQLADLDLGFEYSSSPAVVPDGSAAPPRDPVGADYRPVARPGHRLPHAWLVRAGVAVSTHQLLDPARHVLLTGASDAWAEVAAEVGSGVVVLQVAEHGDVQDRTGAWARLRGHTEDGAVLVRPDGHIAFRAQTANVAELRRALDVCTGRSGTTALEAAT